MDTYKLLHKINIIHGDCKAEHIFIPKSISNPVKLIDFSHARFNTTQTCKNDEIDSVIDIMFTVNEKKFTKKTSNPNK